MNVCITLTVVMVSWVCTYVQIQQITQLYTVNICSSCKTHSKNKQTNQKLSLDSHCPESKIQNLPWISHNIYLKKLSFTSLILSSNLFPLSLCSSNTGFFFFCYCCFLEMPRPFPFYKLCFSWERLLLLT